MLLQNILSGEETSPLVLIHDDVELSGRRLTCSFVQSLLQRVDYVVAVLYDLPPEKFLSFVDKDLQARIYCFDGFSDPLHWDTHSGDRAFIHKDSNVVELVKASFTQLDSTVKKVPGEPTKVAVVIDSLSKLLLWHSSSSTCCSVHQLCSINVVGFQVVQVVCLVHMDLHDKHTLDCINSLASSHISVSLDTSALCLTDQLRCCCKVLHKRKSGKVLRKMQQYRITMQGAHLFDFPEHGWHRDCARRNSEDEVDPTSNLSFNLKLSEDERVARAKLSLPYMFHKNTKDAVDKGNIFYQPDEVDDFDEEDPDNDLDI